MPNQTFTTLYPQAGDPELLLLAKIAAAEGRMSLTTDFPIPANGAWLPAANTLEFAVNSLAQYRIAPLGVFSWYDGAGGTRMTLNSTALGVGVAPVAGRGALQLSAGVGFPATQVASSDVNTLDDYEEGTFTPTIVGSPVAGVGVYTNQDGKYTKIGNIVHCQITLAWTAHTGTGGMLFSLPFPAAAGSGFASGTIGTISNVALSAGYVAVAYVGDGQSLAHIDQYPSGGGASIVVPMDVAGAILVSMTYRV